MESILVNFFWDGDDETTENYLYKITGQGVNGYEVEDFMYNYFNEFEEAILSNFLEYLEEQTKWKSEECKDINPNEIDFKKYFNIFFG